MNLIVDKGNWKCYSYTYNTHFKGADHPEFFSNLTQLIKFAESRVSNYGEAVEEVVEPIVEEVEVIEVLEVIENSTLENKDYYKLVRENDGHKFYAKAFDSREEARFNSRYDYQSQIFENGKWFNHSNYGYSEDYSTHPKEAEENKEHNAVIMPESKSSFRIWLEIMIDEKGVDIDSEIKIDGHFGLTYKSLIEFLEGVPEEHKKIKNSLIYIDTKNGNIFHYINRLAECMVKSC